MLWSSLLLAVREVRRNILRSFLTVLGIVIGVSAVITMVTLGNGATESVRQQVESLGSNLLMLRQARFRRGPPGSAGASGPPPFRMSDIEAIQERIPGIAAVAPEIEVGTTVVAYSKNWNTEVVGSTSEYFIAANWELANGRFFNAQEASAGSTLCVIGETIRRELFGTEYMPVGDVLRVKNFSCEIIGVLQSKGQSAMGDQDDKIIMPLGAVQRRLAGSRRSISDIMVSVENAENIDSVKEQLTQLMRERRRLADNEDNDFNVLDTRQIADALSGTTQVLTGLLGAVASVSLLVGGIGIMNIMLVSVTERTREIGIRLAIGALEREVLLQFLIEAVVLAALGGLMGIVLATIASVSLAALMGLPYHFDVAINLISFLFSAGIGVLFGYMPARRAAQLDPIDALRHE
ncbi:ABC transporter permease [Microbulbifer sp. CAU 1566]|uniref:ABC transporter permease n=1 Tax=Microbulbifer sp. CAU 1566 TaxID=2933269 RepID=UPI0020044F1C|nr:ABC transporter permease [Microbulbifer sp. CAU 1566]